MCLPSPLTPTLSLGGERGKGVNGMNIQSCMIEGCANLGYAPAGTGTVCKDHFSDFVTWRRKKGGKGMFRKYNGMTMVERDTIVEEWQATLATPH